MVFTLVPVIPVRSRDLPFPGCDPPSQVHALCIELLKVERRDL